MPRSEVYRPDFTPTHLAGPRGTFVRNMPPPWAYHRFHLPVSGRIEEAFIIQGTVAMEVDLVDEELIASDATTTGFEFSETRGVLTIDTSGAPAGDLGIVAVVPVATPLPVL